MPNNRLVRINIRTNAGKAKLEVRNGREVMVVPSATMPDNVVMNGIHYPADEIAKSYATLEDTYAPFGHPVINGAYVSAKKPEAVNIFGVGAFNTNVRRQNGRVFLDKVIDVEVARASAKGRSLLAAIDEGKPIHTSTGLLAHLEKAAEGIGYDFIARDIEFDHDAILTTENGAATPEQGVGIFVNANNEKIEVINSILGEEDQAGNGDETFINRLVHIVTNALRGSKKEADGMAEENKELKELSLKVNGLEEKLNGIGEQITNAVNAAVKPLTDNLAAIKANQDAKDAAELADLTAKIVKANLMTEAGAKGLTLNAARELAEKAKPGTAVGINANGFTGGDGKPSFLLPKGDK